MIPLIPLFLVGAGYVWYSDKMKKATLSGVPKPASEVQQQTAMRMGGAISQMTSGQASAQSQADAQSITNPVQVVSTRNDLPVPTTKPASAPVPTRATGLSPAAVAFWGREHTPTVVAPSDAPPVNKGLPTVFR